MGFENAQFLPQSSTTSPFLFLPSVAYSLSRYSSAPAAAASRPIALRSVEQPLHVRHEQPYLLLLSSARCCPPPPSQHNRRHLLRRCCTSVPLASSLFPSVTTQRHCCHGAALLFAPDACTIVLIISSFCFRRKHGGFSAVSGIHSRRCSGPLGATPPSPSIVVAAVRLMQRCLCVSFFITVRSRNATLLYLTLFFLSFSQILSRSISFLFVHSII